MRDHLSRRPSPAMVVAVIALICALTGTAWAALGKNSVGSKQLKSNAVTTAKIKKEAVTAKKVKKDTLTGTQIDESKLGPVPVANSIPPAEATHLVGAPGEPTFENGAANAGALSGLHLNSAGFFKDHEGIVHLEGIVKPTSSEVKTIFTLPVGDRPAPGSVLIFQTGPTGGVVIGGANTAIESTDLSGKVAGTSELIVLEGITFRAAG
jgi:hypothetical protein